MQTKICIDWKLLSKYTASNAEYVHTLDIAFQLLSLPPGYHCVRTPAHGYGCLVCYTFARTHATSVVCNATVYL